MPSSYIKYGVDFDGNGHVDLRHSIPDVLASTANLLQDERLQDGRSPTARAHANFEAMREWNRAVIYRKTIGYFADQLVEAVTLVIPGRASLAQARNLARQSQLSSRTSERSERRSGTHNPGKSFCEGCRSSLF